MPIPPALAVAVADAVTSALNAASLSQSVVAERHYLPVFDLQEMQALHVSVVPKGMTVAQSSRDSASYDVLVDVAVQKKVDPSDLAELDALMRLVEEIADLFRFRRLDGEPMAVWVKTEHSFLFAPEHLQQLRQFTSVLTLTFRVIR